MGERCCSFQFFSPFCRCTTMRTSRNHSTMRRWKLSYDCCFVAAFVQCMWLLCSTQSKNEMKLQQRLHFSTLELTEAVLHKQIQEDEMQGRAKWIHTETGLRKSLPYLVRRTTFKCTESLNNANSHFST